MSCIPYINGRSIIHRSDPRVRVIVAFLFAILMALANDYAVLVTGFFLALATVSLAGISPRYILKRLLSLNLFMLILFVLLPVSTPGKALFSLINLNWSDTGFLLAGRITLRANAILLGYTALVSTMSPVVLGHALNKLKLPDGLVHLLLFTVRYVSVLLEEYHRLLRMMKMRNFRNRFNKHTLKSYGYLIGMLLIKSFERSERILASMKCRGFKGKFYLMDTMEFHGKDALFTGISMVLIATLGIIEWV